MNQILIILAVATFAVSCIHAQVPGCADKPAPEPRPAIETKGMVQAWGLAFSGVGKYHNNLQHEPEAVARLKELPIDLCVVLVSGQLTSRNADKVSFLDETSDRYYRFLSSIAPEQRISLLFESHVEKLKLFDVFRDEYYGIPNTRNVTIPKTILAAELESVSLGMLKQGFQISNIFADSIFESDLNPDFETTIRALGIEFWIRSNDSSGLKNSGSKATTELSIITNHWIAPGIENRGLEAALAVCEAAAKPGARAVIWSSPYSVENEGTALVFNHGSTTICYNVISRIWSSVPTPAVCEQTCSFEMESGLRAVWEFETKDGRTLVCVNACKDPYEWESPSGNVSTWTPNDSIGEWSESIASDAKTIHCEPNSVTLLITRVPALADFR